MGSSSALPTPEQITVLILAGGLARRMGKMEKALLPLAGRPLLAHILDRLSPQTVDIVLNANGDPHRFGDFPDLRVIPDIRPNHQGPLAGVEAGLKILEAFWILTVPADLPFLPSDLVRQLCNRATRPDFPVVAQSYGRIHPVVSLWPKSILAPLNEYLDSGQKSLMGWLRHTPHVTVDFQAQGEALDPFFNINTPEDLATANLYVSQRAAQHRPQR